MEHPSSAKYVIFLSSVAQIEILSLIVLIIRLLDSTMIDPLDIGQTLVNRQLDVSMKSLVIKDLITEIQNI